MFWKPISLCAAALGLGMCVLGPVRAQTTISDGAGNVIVTGGGRTVLRDGAGNSVLTHSGRSHGTVIKGHRRTAGRHRAVIDARDRSGSARMTTGSIRAHQSDGQYGTITKGGITGRDKNGEKGSISAHGISGL